MLDLSCPRCSKVIERADRTHDIARCSACGLVFDPRAQEAALREVARLPALTRHDSIPPPESVSVASREVVSGAGYRDPDEAHREVFLVLRQPVSAWLTWPPWPLVLRWHVRLHAGVLSSEPWPAGAPGPSIAVGDIDQLYCRHEKLQRNADAISVAYSVEVMLKSGATVTLVRHLRDPRQALFVEQMIESALGIEDRIVAGELTGG